MKSLKGKEELIDWASPIVYYSTSPRNTARISKRNYRPNIYARIRIKVEGFDSVDSASSWCVPLRILFLILPLFLFGDTWSKAFLLLICLLNRIVLILVPMFYIQACIYICAH